MFARMLDLKESNHEKKHRRKFKGKAFEGVFFRPTRHICVGVN